MNLGRYRLVAELGRGGMGIIHLASTGGPGGFEKLVAVKELRPDLAPDPEYRRMFLEEARLSARLSHPNIVDVHEVACDGARWFMAMELLRGCSLGRAKKRLGARWPLRLGVRVLAEVLGALDHAHDLGVVHRDVSPENVFLGFDGRVKLLDFGVAKAVDRPCTTRHGVVKGSVHYLSPDHVAAAPIDGRADVFAVGVLLREMLTGERLWPDDLDDASIVRRLAVGHVPPFPVAALRTTPKALREICTKATSADRARRWATAREMRDALDAWLAAEDPRGSLAELGSLLRRELPDEDARIDRLVDAERDAISLPPSELVTVASTRIEAPMARRREPRRQSWGPLAIGLVAVVAAVGFVMPREHAPAPALAATPIPPTVHAVVAAPAPTSPPTAAPADAPAEEAAEEPAASPPVDPYDPGY